ncbi:cbb3-type cytochrome c oxidase N-terminal domain-containing protein [Puia sp. P3]|uniref:cbb3-type cytochrome c oxidase N-terminal domain-containing protein n=1 Tax=Puia sp. P3 TaxID=3423952 RepID=UPI003D678EE8
MPPISSSTDNPFVVFMIVVILILALAILMLANLLLGAAQVKAEDSEKKESDGTHAAGLLFAATAVNGISDTAFYILLSVIILEVLIILTLIYNVRILLFVRKERISRAGSAAPRAHWWDRVNRLRPIGEEADLDLGHDYDGIRELDNRLPPWWLYGFYCTIIFAGVYLWRYHIGHVAPSSLEEYAIEVRKADAEKQEYLKRSANNVDENTVKLLTGEGDLAAGKTVFETTCFACHGKRGEGAWVPILPMTTGCTGALFRVFSRPSSMAGRKRE